MKDPKEMNEQMDETTQNPETENNQVEQEFENQDTNAETTQNEQASDNDPLKELNDKYLRMVAEFDNYRKRVAKEKLELIKNAGEDVIVSLLDVLDDVDRAWQQIETSEDLTLIKEGIQLVFNKMKKTLQSKGLNEINATHEEFDTDLHEALTEIPAPTPELSGKVVDMVSKGYKLNDKVIRHAKVVVGK